jgi:hypothetical protein
LSSEQAEPARAAEPADDALATARSIEKQLESSDVKVESRRKSTTKRVLVWLLFGAFFGLMPLFAVTLKEVFSP